MTSTYGGRQRNLMIAVLSAMTGQLALTGKIDLQTAADDASGDLIEMKEVFLMAGAMLIEVAAKMQDEDVVNALAEHWLSMDRLGMLKDQLP